MRVVGGEARGRRLAAPPVRSTRPTSDRVREAMFDMLGSLDAVEGALVADLFAGSGALGIEALSRGAAGATFVDQDRRAAAVIHDNLRRTGLSGPAVRVVTADVLRWLDGAPPFRLVFADPPYAFADWPALFALLRPRCELVAAESDHELEPPAGWQVLRVKHYGSTVVVLARSLSER